MIDSHCHLDFDTYDKDRDEVIKEAHDSGISMLFNIGADMSSSERSVKLASSHKNLYATVGVHPHDAKSVDKKALDRLKYLSQNNKVVGIGEIGLDYYRDLSPRPIQQKAFRDQLELAVELKLPVVIHTRDAFEDTVKIIEPFASRLSGGVFHCFPGSADDARRIIDLGFVIGVGGVVTYKNSSMGKMVQEIDLKYIMLETDAPYLTPVPFRGKRNKPSHVRLVAEKIVQLKECSFSEVETITDRVTKKLFGLAETFGG